jgi:hypothetical protein
MLAKHKLRAERAGSENLVDIGYDLTHYDYSSGNERIVDWSNNALSFLEMPDLGWGSGSTLITELYLDNNTLREFPLPILDLRYVCVAICVMIYVMICVIDDLRD